jgi:hypothetical protein
VCLQFGQFIFFQNGTIKYVYFSSIILYEAISVAGFKVYALNMDVFNRKPSTDIASLAGAIVDFKHLSTNLTSD